MIVLQSGKLEAVEEPVPHGTPYREAAPREVGSWRVFRNAPPDVEGSTIVCGAAVGGRVHSWSPFDTVDDALVELDAWLAERKLTRR